MKIGIIQADVVWLDPTSNIEFIREQLEATAQQVDLLVLCEMALTGYALRATDVCNAADSAEYILNELQSICDEFDIAIMGSTPYKDDDGSYRNRAFLLQKSAAIQTYDKVHLFTPAGEGDCYKSGEKVVNFTLTNGIKIRPAICYDLRFPPIAYQGEAYDLLVYMANWPIARISHWDTLLAARAIENQTYTIGVNRIGTDNNGYTYPGHSALFGYDGHEVINAASNSGLFIAQLEFAKQEEYRLALPFREDR